MNGNGLGGYPVVDYAARGEAYPGGNAAIGGLREHVNALVPFFGQKRYTEADLRADNKAPHETWTLPDFYKGHNAFLGERIDFLIREECEWPTSELLPWTPAPDGKLSFTWDIYHYDETFIEEVAPEAMPRLTTSSRESHGATMVRHGLAFRVNHEFYKTPKGIEEYHYNLAQIALSVRNTANYGAIVSLYEAPNQYREMQRHAGGVRANCYEDLMRWHKRCWACVQKERNGLDLLFAESKGYMSTITGSAPTGIVVPNGCMQYLSLVPPHKTEFFRSGQATNLALDATAPGTFHGLKVFETYPFNADILDHGVDPTERLRMCGVYNVMVDRSPKVDKIPQDYRSDHRSIMAYDMDSDSFRKITLDFAMQNVLDYDDDANIGPVWTHFIKNVLGHSWDPFEVRRITEQAKTDVADPSIALPSRRFAANEGADVAGWNNAAYAYYYAARMLGHPKTVLESAVSAEIGTDPRLPVFIATFLVYDGTPFDGFYTEADCATWATHYDDPNNNKTQHDDAIGPIFNTLRKMVAMDYQCPVGFVLLRPFCTYRMSSAALVQQGRGLGCTYYGHQSMHLGDDVKTKVHFANYSIYMKNILMDPRKVLMLEDVFCKGYVNGENLVPFKEGKDVRAAAHAGGATAIKESMIILPVPARDGTDVGQNKILNPLDITGRYPNYVIEGENVGDNSEHFRGAREYGLAQYVRDIQEMPPTFRSDMSFANTVCWQGAQFEWNYNSGQGGFTYEIENTGHWGRTYAGCKRVRSGQSAFLREGSGPMCLQ